MKRVLLFGILILSFHLLVGQVEIPGDLKKKKVAMIQYSYDDWDDQFIDSTNGQWVLNRYGKDRLYEEYKETFEKVVSTFKKHRIRYTIVDSQSHFDRKGFDYLFDYKQKMIDNYESIVADKHLGGFFFEDLHTGRRYAPIVENKKYISRIFRKSLRTSSP